MPKTPIEEFVEAVLNRLHGKPTEDVVQDVFMIIESNSDLHCEYKALCKHFKRSRLSGPGNVNPTISSWVKKKTGRSTISSGHRGTRSSLIKTYSKLG